MKKKTKTENEVRERDSILATQNDELNQSRLELHDLTDLRQQLEETQFQNRNLSEEVRTKIETVFKLSDLNKTLSDQLASISQELATKDEEGKHI